MMKMEDVFEEQKRQLPFCGSEPTEKVENNNTTSQKMHYSKAVSTEKSRNSVTPTDVQDVEF